jgi:hypothetical protein
MRNRLMKSIREYVGGFHPSLLEETPSPVSPSPYEGEGELLERGASPLLDTPFLAGIFRGTQSPFSRPSLLYRREIREV